jgi:hypothetical protein
MLDPERANGLIAEIAHLGCHEVDYNLLVE